MNNQNSFCKYLPKIEKSHSVYEEDTLNKQNFISNDQIIPNIKHSCEISNKVSKKQKHTIDRNCDIMEIHTMILDILEQNYKELGELKKRLDALEWIRNNTIDDLEKIDAKKEIFQLKRKINITKDRKQIEKYKKNTQKMLEKYKSFKTDHQTFIYNPNTSKGDDNEQNIIKKFLMIASNYIDINPYKQKPKKLLCERCKRNDFDITDENLYTCNDCGLCIKIIDETHSFKDADRINLSSRYTYTKKGHFKEAIDKFQAKQNTTIDKKVYNMLYNEFEKHHLSIEKVTKELIYMFLSDNGYSKHYEDITLIYCTLANTKPPDISKYENELLDKHEQQEKIYEQIKEESRINSLNVNYKLLKLLELVGYKCKREDFATLKTREKISDHDEKWKEICALLRWKFIPTKMN